MKLILHHFWKDVRLMRWGLALWLLAAVAQVVMCVLSVQSDFQASNDAYQVVNVALFNFPVFGIWAFLITRLVQTDPVVGTTSFWRTRPISRSVLVSSKLIFIFLLVILPSLLVHGIEFSLFRVEPDAMRDMMAAYLISDLFFVLTLTFVASYTRNFAQFFMAACVVGVAFVVCMVHSAPRLLNGHESDLARSRYDVESLLLNGSLMVSLVLLYAFRRERAGLIVGITGVISGLVAGMAWPLAFTGDDATRGNKVAHVVYQVTANHQSAAWMQETNMGAISEATSVSVLPPPPTDQGRPVPDWAQTTFREAGGQTIDFLSSSNSFLFPGDWQPVLQKLNPDLTVPALLGPGPGQIVTLSVPLSEADRVRGGHGLLSIRLGGKLITLVKECDMPLNGSKFARIPNGVLWITSVASNEGSLTVQLNFIGYARSAQPGSGIVCLFVDKKDRVGITPQDMGGSSSYGGILEVGGYQRIASSRSIGINEALLPPAVLPLVHGKGIGDWVLEVYETKPMGTFVSDLTIPDWKS